MGLVYKWTSPSGKSYIGVTKNTLENRVHEHIKCHKISKTIFSKALRKYHYNLWTIEILHEGDVERMRELEIQEIIAHRTVYPNGYNMKTEKCGGYNEVMRESMRKGCRRISALKRKNGKSIWDRPGYREQMAAKFKAAWQDPNVRRKRYEAATRRWANPEARQKQSEKLKAAIQKPDVRRRRYDAAKRRWADPKARQRQSEKLKAAWARRR